MKLMDDVGSIGSSAAVGKVERNAHLLWTETLITTLTGEICHRIANDISGFTLTIVVDRSQSAKQGQVALDVYFIWPQNGIETKSIKTDLELIWRQDWYLHIFHQQLLDIADMGNYIFNVLIYEFRVVTGYVGGTLFLHSPNPYLDRLAGHMYLNAVIR